LAQGARTALDPAEVSIGRALLMMVAGVSILSFGPWLVRLAGIDAAASAFWRLSLAIGPIFLLAALAREPAHRPPGDVLRIIAGAGTVYGIGMIAMNASALETSLANCALIGNFSSFFVAGAALAGARRAPSAGVVVALITAAVGLALLLGPSASFSSSGWKGDLLALIAALLFSVYFVLLPKIAPGPGPLTIHGIATTTGAIVIAPVALQGNMIVGQWWPIVGLAFAQVVGQGLVVYSVPRIPSVWVGLCLLLYPLQSMVIGWLFYGEIMSLGQMAGAGLILAALVLLRSGKAAA
jgi:drug/metabolite transporter (DMT)-like permease